MGWMSKAAKLTSKNIRKLPRNRRELVDIIRAAKLQGRPGKISGLRRPQFGMSDPLPDQGHMKSSVDLFKRFKAAFPKEYQRVKDVVTGPEIRRELSSARYKKAFESVSKPVTRKLYQLERKRMRAGSRAELLKHSGARKAAEKATLLKPGSNAAEVMGRAHMLAMRNLLPAAIVARLAGTKKEK
jgi:hypothetical protein